MRVPLASFRSTFLFLTLSSLLHSPLVAAEVVVLRGHKENIYSVALSPDGKRVATGGVDGTPRLWDAATGKQLALLHKHDGWVQSVKFSPDGRLLAASCEMGEVRLWDATNGTPQRVLRVGDYLTRKLDFSPDSRLIAVAGSDKKVHIWEAASGKPWKTLKMTQNGWSVAFSPDGSILAGGDKKGEVRIWEMPSGAVLHTIKGHEERVFWVNFSPDGRVLASCGEDGRVRLWDVRTGMARAVVDLRMDVKVNGIIWSVLFLDGGRSLLSAGGGALCLNDTATGKKLDQISGHGDVTHAIAVSPDGRLLASAGSDGLALLRQAPTRPAVPSGSLNPDKLLSLWNDLKGGTDAHAVHRAIWSLALAPADAVPFLRERLKPAAKEDPARLAQWVAELDDRRFAVRERAARELADRVWAAEPHLRRALANKPSTDLRRQLETLLASMRRAEGGGSSLRDLWSVEALEYAGTKDARALLRDLANGAEGHPLTEEAKASLRRMERSFGKP